MKKQFMALLAAAVVSATTIAAPVTAHADWVKSGNSWKYQEDDGNYYAGGLEWIGSKLYYFDNSGIMQTGWLKIDGNWYYFDANGAGHNGWLRNGGTYYYISNGYMQKNTTIEENGNAYLMAADGSWVSNGTGWRKIPYEDGTPAWCYMESGGKLATGWRYISGDWYYFNDYGFMYANGTSKIGNTAYIFNSDGSLSYQSGWISFSYTMMDGSTHQNWAYGNGDSTAHTGWLQVGGTWYYFTEYGDMAYSGAYIIDGKSYFFNGSGELNSRSGWISETFTYDGITYTNWYYGNSDGTLVTGWKWIDGSWYYFGESGTMYSGDGQYSTGIDGRYYIFTSSGALKTNAWTKRTFTDYEGTSYSNWYYSKADGVLATGWNKINGKWYYFYEGGSMAEVEYWDYLSINHYFFYSDGSLKTGWVYDGYDWYYYSANGDMATGWKEIDGNWYYFDTEYSGYLYTDGTYEINGEICILAEDGARIG